MKKQTFYGLLFLGTMITVPVLAHFPSDYEISKAEADSVHTLYEESQQPYTDEEWEAWEEAHPRAISLPEEFNQAEEGDVLTVEKVDRDSIYLGFSQDYKIRIENDQIKITDPHTGKLIYTESLNSNSKMARAILKDNE